ncbi:MAG: YceI family protein [Pseudomonadota bacterium]
MKPAIIAATAALMTGLSAHAADWTVIHDESRLGIIGHQSGAAFEGAFLDFDAAISFDPADPAAATIDVQIDMSSLDTDNAQRDDMVRGGDLFDVATYPTAQFTASGFAVEGEGAFETTGELTIRDVTQQVSLPFTLTIEGNRAHATGELVINRIDFGVGQGQWASDDPVAFDVSIVIDIVAEAAN